MYEVEKRKIKEMLGSEVYDMLKETKCVLAGGAITSLFTNREINDFDLYFTSKESLSQVFAQAFGVSEDEFLSPYDLIVKFATKRSMLCVDKYGQQKLQFIHYKIHDNIESIFQSFDFEHVMGAFDFATEEFVLHENFMKANAQRLIQFNPATDFPITSMMRVQKYKERQYTISKAQMLRIAFTIANKEYASWEDVKSEVSGLYGIAPEDMFDETKPFSLEEVVLQLDKLVLNDKYVNTKQPTFQECVDLTKHNFSDNFNNYLAQFEDDDENSKEIWWFPKDKYYKAQNDKYDAEKKYTVPTLTEVINAWIDPPEEEVDDYGNPVSGDRIINCCFPDCGCDGARCCQAENGASGGACSMNIERGTLKF